MQPKISANKYASMTTQAKSMSPTYEASKVTGIGALKRLIQDMRKTYTPKAFASEQQSLPECWFEDENYPECSVVTFEEDQSKTLKFMAEPDP